MRRPDRAAVYVLFTLSGFAGLVYESIWTHYLKLFLGHAAFAQALVLGIFMGGLALGSWLASRFSGRIRNLLVAYALVEGLIGVLALAFHGVFVAATAAAYDAVLPALVHAPFAASAFKWSLSTLLILPQSVLLGMTFPLMTAGVLRLSPDRPGRSLAMLYFTNSIGAAAGVLVSGFVLIHLVGLPGTVRVAGVLNLVVAAEMWRRFGRRAAAEANAARSVETGRRRAVLFLGVALVTGASSFVYEVAWIRMLSLVLGSSTHAFELMLSAFILGLALGGLWIQRRIDGITRPVAYLSIVQVAMGLLALATLPAYGSTFDAMRWLMGTLPRTGQGYVLFNLASNGIAMAVMLPATFCAGMTLPLITMWLLRDGRGEASIGAVYAANTVGAIAAVFLATQVALPLLGLKGLLVIGAALDLALGVALAWLARPEFRLRWVPATLGALSVAAVALVLLLVQLDPYRLASGVYRSGKFIDPEAEQVALHADGKTATVDIIKHGPLGQVFITTNGKPDAAVTMSLDRPASIDEPTMYLLGVVPLALHPQARSAAAIGFGSGLTTHTLLSSPRLESVDTVEIEEEMVRAAEHFRPRNELAYTDARSHVHIDDAKSFFAAQARRYDLLISEPSNPWVSGVAGLFSDEFYARARRHLAEGGLFVQWIQLYEIDPELVVSVLKALDRNFADYAIYAANDTDGIIVATAKGTVPEPSPEVLELPSLAVPLRRSGVASVSDLAVRKIGDRRSWEGLTRSYAIAANSDYRPVLDQGAARARFLGSSAAGLIQFGRIPLPMLEMLTAQRSVDASRVTASPHFEGSRRAHHAALIRDLVLGRGGPGLIASMPGDVYRSALPLATWYPDCGARSAAPLPLQSLLSVAAATVPDLTPAELHEMWRPLEVGACAARVNPHDRAWIEFVVAVGDRDATRMATTSRALLVLGPALAPPTVRYLLAAGMLGSIVAGQPDEAARLWAEQSGGMQIDENLLLRALVAASAKARPIVMR